MPLRSQGNELPKRYSMNKHLTLGKEESCINICNSQIYPKKNRKSFNFSFEHKKSFKLYTKMPPTKANQKVLRDYDLGEGHDDYVA